MIRDRYDDDKITIDNNNNDPKTKKQKEKENFWFISYFRDLFEDPLFWLRILVLMP